MSSSSRPIQYLTWGFLLIVMLVISLAYVTSKVRNAAPPLPVYGNVADFTLTNQAGQVVSLASLRGQVWVADIIFTRCPGPCSRMTKKMAELQALLPPDLPVKLVSLTTDPGYDQPEVLRKYGERFGADFNRWNFLTGRKPVITGLAVDGLKLITIDKQPGERVSAEDLFIHSTMFVLVDKQGRVRASFDMLPPPPIEGETNAIPADAMKERDTKEHVLEVIRRLLKEK